MFKKNDNSFELISCYVAIGSKTDTIILVFLYLHIISIFQILRDVSHNFLIRCYTCSSSEARRRNVYSFLGVWSLVFYVLGCENTVPLMC